MLSELIFDNLGYTILILILTLIILLCGAFYSYGNTRPKYIRPPGPTAWPIIGDLARLGRRPHLTLFEWRAKYGDIYSIQMGSWPTIVLNGIDVIKQAMVKQSKEFAGRPDFFTFRLLAGGKSMGFATFSPRWRVHRRVAQNALAHVMNNDKTLHDFIQEEAAFLCDILTGISEAGGSVDPHDEIFKSVGSIICCLCFGKKYKREDADFVKLIQMNADFMAFVGAGNPVDVLPWMRHLMQRSLRNFMKILDTMEEFVLKHRREHLETFDPSTVRDIQDFLIKSTKEISDSEKQASGITDDHILVTVQEMIGAGFDTIATTLQWSFLYMAMFEDCQKKAHAEINNVIGNNKRPEISDIPYLPYVEACILETMRLSCIFPLALPHSTTVTTQLKGFTIEKDTLVFINLWSMTRDESVFPDASRFNPERFLIPNKGGVNKYEIDKSKAELILPFGAGKRRCPGELLAKAEIFLFLTTMLQNCKISLCPGEKYSLESQYGLTLKPKRHNLVFTRM